MTITYQFEVQSPYIQPPYYDGMRGAPDSLAGGIFSSRSAQLSSLGDAAADVAAQAIGEFNTKYMALRNEVLTAQAQFIAAGPGAGNVQTFANNVARLDAIAAQVRAGDVAKATSVATVASALIAQARGYVDDARVLTIESIAREILEIPPRLAAAVEAIAKTTGQAAGALLRGAGIEPKGLVDATAQTAMWLGLGALGLAVIYLSSR